MDVTGSYTLYAPRDRVWALLFDPDVLRATVPGCERLEQDGDDRYRVRVNIGVAAVKGVYDGTLRLSDVEPPERYRMTVDGKGARGVLHGAGSLTLEARDVRTTIVHYAGQAQIGGAIAGVGMRVAAGAGNMLIKSFFSRLADVLAAPTTPEADVFSDDTETFAPLEGEVLTTDGTLLSPTASAPLSTEPAGLPATSTDPLAGAVADTDIFAQPSRRVTTATEAMKPSPAVAAALHPHRDATVLSTPRAATRGPLLRLARRSGLTDGSVESEEQWARRMFGGLLLAGAVITSTAALLVRRTRRHP